MPSKDLLVVLVVEEDEEEQTARISPALSSLIQLLLFPHPTTFHLSQTTNPSCSKSFMLLGVCKRMNTTKISMLNKDREEKVYMH